MKKINLGLSLMALCFGVFLLFSCEEIEVEKMNIAPNLYYGIYDAASDEAVDTSMMSFATAPLTQMTKTFNVRVKLLGEYLNSPKSFKLNKLETSTAIENEHYAPLKDEYMFPEGVEYFDVPIEVYRTEDMSLADKKITLTFDLDGNNNFNLDLKETIYNSLRDTVSRVNHTFILSSRYAKPSVWWTYPFGYFSSKKFTIMLSVTGYTAEDFEDSDFMNTDRMIYVGKLTQAYLDEEASNGNVILDEDGEIMKMKK